MRFLNRFAWLAAAAVAALVPTGVQAQQAQQVFGRNRIQHTRLDWQYVQSANFDVYFHQGGEAMARMAADMAEVEFQRISEMVGYSPYNRARIYLYDSPERLSESNLGLDQTGSILGGRTSFIKNIVEVAFTGSRQDFRRHLARGISRALIYDMMYGGSFTEAVQSSYLMMLPEWFTEGAILYVADGWSIQMDNYLRSEGLARNLKRPVTLRGEAAAVVGQSIWAFIADRYGRANVSNILNLTRIIRNEENAITSTLGTNFGRLVRDWRNYHYSQAESVLGPYREPTSEEVIKSFKLTRGRVNSYVLSPDGSRIAISRTRQGRTHIEVVDVETRRLHAVWVMGEKQVDEKAPRSIPLAWRGNDALTLVRHRKGMPELVELNVNKFAFLGLKPNIAERTPLEGVDLVRELTWSTDGKICVLSASLDGQNDLYELKGGRLKNLTRNEADDANPIVSPKGNFVFYATNQQDDTSYAARQNLRRGRYPQQSIYKISLTEAKARPEHVLSRAGNVYRPFFAPGGRLIAISDETGIPNLVVVNPDTTANLTTNLANGLLDAQYSSKLNRAVTLVQFDGKQRFIRQDSITKTIYQDLPFTRWRELNPAKTWEPATAQAAPAPPPSIPPPATPAFVPVDTNRPRFRIPPTQTQTATAAATQPADTAQVPPAGNPDEEPVDIRNYVFESEKRRAAPQTAQVSKPVQLQQPNVVPGVNPGTGGVNFTTPGQSATQPARSEPISAIRSGRKNLQQKEIPLPPVTLSGPYDYRNRLSAGNVTSNATIDPLRGIGIQMEVGMNDLFENHRFYVKALPFLDLRSSIMELQYHYLKERIDFSAGFVKNSIFIEGPVYGNRNTLYRYQVGASYPISEAARITVSPFYTQTNFIKLGESSNGGLNADRTRRYLGARAEAVFDNSITSSSGVVTGTRARLIFEHHANFIDSGKRKPFSQIAIDVRRYQRIHREITLALRASAGQFWGPGRKMYMIGGMDNWIFQEQHVSDNENDPLSPTNPLYQREGYTDILFNPFVTNLRGFDYNTAYGNSYALMNVELRLPLIRYLYNGPIASNFLRNFQLVGFYDIGAAWSGAPIWTRNNTVNSITKPAAGPIEITYRTFRNPWLSGYGAGVRTMLLGYYAKFDVAWGRNNGITSKEPKLYLTLGHDF